MLLSYSVRAVSAFLCTQFFFFFQKSLKFLCLVAGDVSQKFIYIGYLCLFFVLFLSLGGFFFAALLVGISTCSHEFFTCYLHAYPSAFYHLMYHENSGHFWERTRSKKKMAKCGGKSIAPISFFLSFFSMWFKLFSSPLCWYCVKWVGGMLWSFLSSLYLFGPPATILRSWYKWLYPLALYRKHDAAQTIYKKEMKEESDLWS